MRAGSGGGQLAGKRQSARGEQQHPLAAAAEVAGPQQAEQAEHDGQALLGAAVRREHDGRPGDRERHAADEAGEVLIRPDGLAGNPAGVDGAGAALQVSGVDGHGRQRQPGQPQGQQGQAR